MATYKSVFGFGSVNPNAALEKVVGSLGEAVAVLTYLNGRGPECLNDSQLLGGAQAKVYACQRDLAALIRTSERLRRIRAKRRLPTLD